jgi:RNA polymerase sigma-70 factor, ECF subfamily
VLVLHYVVGLSVQEAARQLGVPAGTVKSRLARGRAALARQLGEEEQELRHA